MSKRRIYLPVLVLVLLAVVAILHTKFFVKEPIKPEPASVPAVNDDSEETESSGDTIDGRYPNIAALFPQGDWRRTSGNLLVLEGEVGFFIFKDEPTVSEDGTTLTFKACTLVALPPIKDGVDEDERYRSAFLFESNESVSITLDCSFTDFTRFKSKNIGISNVKEGRVQGEIVIRSPMGTPEPDDDFELRARDVVFNMHQIVANLKVSLRYGRNSCAGRGLTIDLDVPTHWTTKNAKRLSSQTTRETDLQKVDALVEDGNIGSGFSLKSVKITELTDCFRYYYQKPKSESSTNDEQTPSNDPCFEIRCNRGVFFSSIPGSIGGWCARFNKDVDFVSYRNGIKSEQALCETLYLYLQDPEVEQLAQSSEEVKERLQRKKVTGSLGKLEPTTIRALKKNSDDPSSTAEPVEIRLETQKLSLKTNEIFYDLRERLLTLIGDQTQHVQIYSTGELKSASKLKRLNFNSEFVQAQLSEQNELKTVFAGKNGALETEFVNSRKEAHKLNVAWVEGLRVEPEPESDGVLKFTSSGEVTFQVDGVGAFNAKEADFWCKINSGNDSEQNKSASVFQTVAMNEKTDKDKLSFEQFEGVVPIGAEFRGGVSFNAKRGKATIQDKVVLRFASELHNATNASEKINAPVQNDGKSFFSNGSLTGDKDDSQFEIQCRQTSFWCVFDNNNNVELRRLQLQGGVSLVERTPNALEEKMKISADVAQIDRPSSPNASVRLAGRTDAPALFRTNDLELTGANVFVDRATNSFQVNGSGSLEFTLPQEALDARQKNESLSGFFTDDPIEIRWSHSMTLAKNVLSFKANQGDRVVVSQETQRLVCPEIRLTLKNNVSLFDANSFEQKKIDFERLDCLGSYEQPVEINAFTNNVANKDVDFEQKKIDFERQDRLGTCEQPVEFNAFTNNVANKDVDIQEGRFYAKLNNLSYIRSEDKIVSTSGGEFRAVVRTKDSFKGVAQIGTNQQNNEQGNETKLEWMLLHAKFQGELTGNTKLREATVSNGVRAVVGQTNDPNTGIDVDASSTFPEKFALITGKKASVQIGASDVATSTDEKQPLAVEIETSNSVVFKSSNVVGRCDKLHYSSPKNTVVMTGSGARKAELYRQEGAGRPKELLGEFARASYRLDTEAFEVESFSFNGD